MTIYVIYQKNNLVILKKCFEKLLSSKKHKVIFVEYKELHNIRWDKYTLYYCDISGLDKTIIDKHIKNFNKEGLYYGIIDFKNTIKDISWLFFNNACDYCNKELCSSPITEKRIQSIIKFKNITIPATATTSTSYIVSQHSWESIVPGNEYTFFFLLIEVLDMNELNKRIGSEHVQGKIKTFKRYCEEFFYAADGRCWMWMDATGLFLFPFTGDSILVIKSAIRLMLNRVLVSLEHTSFGHILRFRIAMHIGNTVYKPPGKTGTIISDSINSLFHLGQKYTNNEGLYITEDIYKLLNGKVQKLFIKSKPFEGRQIYTFKYS